MPLRLTRADSLLPFLLLFLLPFSLLLLVGCSPSSDQPGTGQPSTGQPAGDDASVVGGTVIEGAVEDFPIPEFDPNAPPPPDVELILPKFVWGEPGELDPAKVPNPYVHVGLGVEITRPDEWVWLSRTSNPNFADESDPSMRTVIVTEKLGDPTRTPLISMASSPGAEVGKDMVAHLFGRAIPGNWRPEMAMSRGPTAVIKASSNLSRYSNDNYEVLVEPYEFEISGLAGAAMKSRYDTKDEAEPRAVVEWIWYAPRPPYLFTLIANAPEARAAELEGRIEAIRDSLQIEALDQ